MEGLKFEVKSRFRGSDEEILKIVKTIVAFANTEGGETGTISFYQSWQDD